MLLGVETTNQFHTLLQLYVYIYRYTYMDVMASITFVSESSGDLLL